MSRKYSAWQAPIMAFYNKDFYNDVATNWTGSGILYLFVLTTIAWLISCTAMFAPLASFVDNKEVRAYLQQLPKMTIADGKMSIDKKCPYDIKDPQSGAVIAQFRTDGPPGEIKADDPPFVITATEVFQTAGVEKDYKLTGGESQSADGNKSVFKFEDVTKSYPKLEFDGNDVIALIQALCFWVPLGILLVGWPLVFIAHLAQAALYGLAAQLMASGQDKTIQFGPAMRLAAVAITPCVLITVVLTAVRAMVPPMEVVTGIWAFASIGVALTFLWIGLTAIKPTSPEEISSPSQPA